ncbi:hypothetical protein AWB80_02911 [Caballeronia pedi]|uniref:DUF3846 domain-containing protein n=1 Tax=Caballeronia pedi TaxID=1777141 RepID=A0A158B0X7_9BURK|nr:hypothetical protein [Caballeronia pedi]SAK63732.1 hypothetical protein AWB80_02911 [Caballeronia pedi]
MINAYLIDPFTKTVSKVTRSSDGVGLQALREVYAFVGVDCIDAAHLPNGDAIYVDDIGLDRKQQAYFFVDGYPQILAGRALWVGATREGDDTTPKTPFHIAMQSIGWASCD